MTARAFARRPLVSPQVRPKPAADDRSEAPDRADPNTEPWDGDTAWERDRVWHGDGPEYLDWRE